MRRFVAKQRSIDRGHGGKLATMASQVKHKSSSKETFVVIRICKDTALKQQSQDFAEQKVFLSLLIRTNYVDV
jgi:hypothetical protein